MIPPIILGGNGRAPSTGASRTDARLQPTPTFVTGTLGSAADGETGGWYLGIGVGSGGSYASVSSYDKYIGEFDPGGNAIRLGLWASQASSTNKSGGFTATRIGNSTAGFMVQPFRHWGGHIENLVQRSANTPGTSYPSPPMPASSRQWANRYMVVALVGAGADMPLSIQGWSMVTGAFFNAGGPVQLWSAYAGSSNPSVNVPVQAGCSIAMVAFDLLSPYEG